MNTPEDVLVVGASAAGLAVVESLRRKGYRGRITLLGEEGRPVAVLGWNMPKQARRHRQHIVSVYAPTATSTPTSTPEAASPPEAAAAR
ncbi:hypothetical protein GBW32_25950 [Streptomyces tsukubensis]|uniref:Uncharacterized protein n=1 Tax=Streptomyces tsukubensis TaxID=83656 RepID=A0A1V4AA33_9ACTN|nr:hypothetical protein [Streptomyces tsukubensis]OON79662.1 hypothetical protein B1H18_13925 [Streptomyces tsukubensis]QFR95848.1 hypothetical protein GBW32_25950 [Streptomyces tsukubensis]